MNINYLFVFLLSLTAVFSAYANPIKTVGTGIVNEGQHTAEFRTGWSSDDDSKLHNGRFQSRQMFDYGFTDSYAMRFTAIQDDLGNDGWEHNALMLDNRVQIFENRKHGFDGGFRLTYLYRDGDKKPDLAEARWINHFPFGTYEFRHHVIVQHQVGENSRHGFMPELRWQLTRSTIGKHRAGVEMFNEFGNLRDNNRFDEQMHDAGLVMTGPIWQNLRYHTGYRHGISENAPDHAVKFFIGYDF